jgi:hypothetical protein
MDKCKFIILKKDFSTLPIPRVAALVQDLLEMPHSLRPSGEEILAFVGCVAKRPDADQCEKILKEFKSYLSPQTPQANLQGSTGTNTPPWKCALA